MLVKEFMTSQVLSQPPAVMLPETRAAAASSGPSQCVARKILSFKQTAEFQRTAAYCVERGLHEAASYLTRLATQGKKEAQLEVRPSSVYELADAESRLGETDGEPSQSWQDFAPDPPRTVEAVSKRPTFDRRDLLAASESKAKARAQAKPKAKGAKASAVKSKAKAKPKPEEIDKTWGCDRCRWKRTACEACNRAAPDTRLGERKSRRLGLPWMVMMVMMSDPQSIQITFFVAVSPVASCIPRLTLAGLWQEPTTGAGVVSV